MKKFVLVLAFSIAAASAAGAQQDAAPAAPKVTAADRAAYNAAFQESLRNPIDPPTLVRYAEAALKIGDLEGAIAALERLLLVDGENPEVKLELGVLYFRLGSMEAAKSYLQGVTGSRRASADQKAKAESYIKQTGTP
ncbi:MAG: tetratricopeptide repeat protein [Proteobacteria bacterium]|nr:tetratricopeptide repeat protein [Pseudomonadota bacterium]